MTVRRFHCLVFLLLVCVPACADDLERGGEALNKKDYVSAIALFSAHIQQNPTSAVAFYGRGLAYLHKKEYDKGIADNSEAIRLDPTFASAFNNRGNAYTAAKNSTTKPLRTSPK
jgi:tetratricopeptide (TPR) repeat protein